MKPVSAPSLFRLLAGVLCITGTYTPSTAVANPSGGSVVAGSASFSQNGPRLNVTASNRSILNWQDFSIRAGEETRFILPSASAVSLNRVISGNPSGIYGTLSSNGQIYLINPNGIVVGPGGTINTAGFLASTLDVSNQEFLAGGSLRFSGNSNAAISNLGVISTTGGDVVLAGRNISNSGVIRTANGSVHLAAGGDVLVKPAGTGRLYIRTSAGRIAPNGNLYALAINNSGSIEATGSRTQGGRVFLTTSGGSIQNSGSVTAKRNDSGGRIRIIAGKTGSVLNTGNLDVSGAHGGDLAVTAGSVSIQSGVVNASGASGGGTILIGGGAHGSGGLPGAATVRVGRQAIIHADALAAGNGGSVSLWSNVDTSFQGAISARGAGGGAGGTVDVSSKGALGFAGRVDVTSASGKTGTLLLDPHNITIASGGDAGVGDVSTFGNVRGPDETIDPTALDAAAANVVLQANNDVVVSSAIMLTTAGASLTVQAGRSISINSNIATSGGAISLTANDTAADGVVSAGRDSGSAVLSMAAGTSLNSNGGNISLAIGSGAGLAHSTSGGMSLQSVNAGSGSVALSANSIQLGGPSPGIATASGAISISGAVQLSAGTVLDTTAGGSSPGADIFIHGTLNGSYAFTANAGVGNYTFVGMNVGASVGGVQALASISVSGATLDLEPDTRVIGDQYYSASTLILLQARKVSEAGTITFDGPVLVGNAYAATSGANNSINFLGSVDAHPGGGLTLDAGAGAISMAGPVGAAGQLSSFVVSHASSVAFASTLAANTIALTANEIDFQGGANSVSGGSITMQPLTTSEPINLAGSGLAQSGALNLTFTDLAALNGGFYSIVIGGANQTGVITYAPADPNAGFAFSSPVRLQGSLGSGTILVNGNLSGSQDASITLSAKATRLNGNLTTSGGDISIQNAVLMSDVTLDTGGVSGAITLGSSLNDSSLAADALTLNAGSGGITLTGAVKTALDSISANSAGLVGLSAALSAGSLTVTADAPIAANGSLNVTGAASFDDTLSGASMTLGNRANRLAGSISLVAADSSTITLTNSISTTFASVMTGGNLTSVSAGVTQTGALQVAGLASLASPGSIVLTNPDNSFGTVSVSSPNVSLASGAQINLAKSSVTKSLTLVSGGDIIERGPVSVNGAASFSAGLDIILDEPGNHFNASTSFTSNNGGNVVFTNNCATHLGAISTDGDVTVTSGGGIDSNSAGIQVGGLASFTSTAPGGKITLNAAANSITGAACFYTTGSVAFYNSADTQLDGSTIGGSFALNSGGAVSQLDTVTVGGALAINAAGSITLDDPFNAISKLGTIVRGGDFLLNDTGPLSITGLITAGPTGSNVTIATTGGNLTLASKVSGQNVILASDSDFLNPAGRNAISLTGAGGSYLVYADAPAFTQAGGLPFNFREFNNAYPNSPNPGDTGNGIIFASPQ